MVVWKITESQNIITIKRDYEIPYNKNGMSRVKSTIVTRWIHYAKYTDAQITGRQYGLIKGATLHNVFSTFNLETDFSLKTNI